MFFWFALSSSISTENLLVETYYQAERVWPRIIVLDIDPSCKLCISLWHCIIEGHMCLFLTSFTCVAWEVTGRILNAGSCFNCFPSKDIKSFCTFISKLFIKSLDFVVAGVYLNSWFNHISIVIFVLQNTLQSSSPSQSEF